ncbi:hypothetical protein JL721_8980 [Aureococcus anophagefferens]|nr:hypothetical protein JL721_8980 [Aureococcus anophagefferens]
MGALSWGRLQTAAPAGACACLAALARCADFPRGGLVRAALAVSARDRRRFLALGCLGFGNIFGFVVALSYVTAFNSALLHPVIPVIAAAAAAASGVERLTSRVAFGVGLAAAGALVVVVFGVSGGGGGEANAGASSASVVLGNVILLGHVVFMGRRSFTAGEVAGGVLISAGLAVTVLGRRRDRVADAADDAPPENPFDDEPRRGDDLGVPLTEVV